MTIALRHRDGDTPHLLGGSWDWGSTTWCGRSYYAAVCVEEEAEWTCICWECRRRHANRVKKNVYETPVLRKNRPTDAKKLRRDLQAIDERRKLERFTGRVTR